MNSEDLLAGLLAVAFGLVFVGVGAYMVVPHVQQTTNAEPVDAVVVSSEVVETDGPEGQSNYYANVTYRYTYEGTEYTSDQVFPGEDHGVSASRAEEIVDSHPPGEEVTAHVSPDDPDSAYLIDEGTPWWYYVFPLFGVLAVWMGIGKIRRTIRGEEMPR